MSSPFFAAPSPARLVFAGSQKSFAAALLAPTLPVPDGLTGPDGLPSAKRFAVYRNNVVLGLIETLRAAYPVVNQLVGAEFFTEMARVFVMALPPATPMMFDYGAEFPAFISAFEPAAALPYLPDTARLERGWVEAYHAAEASPLPPAMLSLIAPQDAATMLLVLHPSVRVILSGFPIVSIWQAHIEDDAALRLSQASGGEDALISRPGAEVEMRKLPPGAGVFIQALQTGHCLAEAAQSGLNACAEFDPGLALSGMIEAELIIGYFPQPLNQVAT